jgi:undecaprenyl-diphosphatase
MKKYISGIISGILFGVLVYMLKTYDVAEIGPNGTSVGFSRINGMVHEYTGVDFRWYEITDLIGYAALGICALFGFAGLVQLIKRKSFAKVDKTIYSLAGLYIVVIGLYVFFERFIINYRPVIMPGETAPEASFPSSHTMLIITVMASTAMVLGKYIRNGFLKTVISILCVAVILVTVYGRLICGVHWFTDIIGGILLSVTLLIFFSAVLQAAWKSDKVRYGHAVSKKENKEDHEKIVFGETPDEVRDAGREAGRDAVKGRASRNYDSSKEYKPKH